MQHGFRHDHATTAEHELETPRRPVGRSSLTQRHVARLGDQERADDHARRDAAWLAGPVQRKEKEPTAGPSEDDRFGAGPVAADAHGRILAVNVIGGEDTRITIGMGQKQGIRSGMMGYVVADKGMLCEFQIDDVGERTAFAIVPVRVQDLQGHGDVVVNPATRPGVAAPKQDMKARVLMVSVVEGNQTKIKIGFGERHGARHGMKGYLTDDSGRPYRRFEISELGLDVSEAIIEDVVANVQSHSSVVLNPTK